MRPDVQTFFDEATSTATHLVVDPASRRAAIVEPVLDFEPRAGKLSTRSADAVIAAAEARGLTLAYVLETHVHADHLSAADHIRRRTGAKVVICPCHNCFDQIRDLSKEYELGVKIVSFKELITEMMILPEKFQPLEPEEAADGEE